MITMSQRLDYFALSPKASGKYAEFSMLLTRSPFLAPLAHLVMLRASQINGCAYCLDMHTRSLRKMGVKIEKLALLQVWHEAEALFDAEERAALAWAETVTRVAQTAIPDQDYQAARAVFNEKQLVDLTIAIGLMNTYNRIAIGFRNPPQAVVEHSAAA